LGPLTERKHLKIHADDKEHKRDLQVEYWDVNRQVKRSARDDRRRLIHDLIEEPEQQRANKI
jgi:hypothetical protein